MWRFPISFWPAAMAVLMLAGSGCQMGVWRPQVQSVASTLKQPLVGLPFPGDVPPILPADLPAVEPPLIVSTPERNEVWSLSLHEAVGVALQSSDIIRVLQGDSVFASPATGYDPGIAEMRRVEALAAFDTVVAMSYIGNRYDQPPGAFFGPGVSQTNRRDDGTLQASLVKPWLTGGRSRIAYSPSTGYLYLPSGSSGFNPRYSSNVEASLVQPLLRGAGRDVNRAPIWVAQLRADQSIWDVKESSLALVRSVEEAYWGLQAAHAAMHALDEVIPLIDGTVRIQEERLKAERIIPAELGKARAEQAYFRQQRVEARSVAIEKELQLRNLVGLPPQDGRTILPVDQPTRSPLTVNGSAAMQTALQNRPEIIRRRLGLRIRELELMVARNGLLPQLDLQALYRLNGLGQDVETALSQLASSQYTDWTLGATFSIPLGNRPARVNVQAAELQLTREQAILRQGLHATAHRLSDLIRQLESIREQYDEAEIRLRESNIWLSGARARYEDPPPGGDGQDLLLLVLNDYLLALRSRSNAAIDVARLLAEYNTLLARLEEAQGTLLSDFGVMLQGDPASTARLDAGSLKGTTPLQPVSWSVPDLPQSERVPVTTRTLYERTAERDAP